MPNSWLRIVCATLVAVAAVPAVELFQYRLPIPVEKGEASALLWIPPNAEAIRGVLIAGDIPVERRMTVDPAIRAVCAEQSLAILSSSRGLGGIDVQALLDGFAGLSGYRELSVAPLAFFGHSAGGPQARSAAAKAGARCFALVQHRGGIPAGDPPVLAGVPCLAMAGQFDEFGGRMRTETGEEPAWQSPRNALADYRSADTARLAAYVAEPGAGHFAWSERNARLMALFLGKAAAARIPASWPTDSSEPPTLLTIAPESGWLYDLDLEAATPHPSAPVADYAGQPGRAGWVQDQELAEAISAYHHGLKGRKDQFLRWGDRHWIDAGTRYFFQSLTWLEDGVTLKVHPAYAEVYPEVPNGPRWLGLAGSPVGNSGEPILVKGIGGPIEAVGPDLLRIRHSAIAPATQGSRPTFMAYSPGNDEYRHTELPGMMPRGFNGLRDGRGQTLTMAEIADRAVDAGDLTLEASSDAELPVQFYVAVGPAIIEDGVLRVSQLPRRATFPITVEVHAWQFGRGNDPKVKTATPVVRSFQLLAPAAP